MLEAECTRCKERFVPHGTELEDLIHGERADGQDCGGIGILVGQWLTRRDIPVPDELRHLAKQEQHGWLYPDCKDPDCEFHHPEVRE